MYQILNGGPDGALPNIIPIPAGHPDPADDAVRADHDLKENIAIVSGVTTCCRPSWRSCVLVEQTERSRKLAEQELD